MIAANILAERVNHLIRNVPNFPKEGIIFKDITPLLADAVLCKQVAEHLAAKAPATDVVVGIEARGFLFGPYLAALLEVPFVPVRKKGKLPYKTLEASYALEYGTATIEMHQDALQPGQQVLIHDDLLATGGTAAAAAQLVGQLNAEVAGFSFLIALDFLNGKQLLQPFTEDIYALVHY